ncbi:hypothetical protein [Flavobacterium celericrescens]|uniref:Uncharacterized protein n=1 Tax=Flavobacterium celericrescens TaxID=2709780 RepID=A0ABX0IBH2_9FLAO|nr:hypothetical protein [Flavobacterium celericrescens]NHM03658.1 hypothetical protein [Flavobacterium celericrescens]
MKKIFLLLLSLQVFSQEKENNDEILFIQDIYLSQCFEELQIIDELNKYPTFENQRFCNLEHTMYLFAYKEEFVRKEAVKRLKEIAKLFYLENKYIVLTHGMDSFYISEKENLNLKDDNGKIYISLGECVIPNSMNEAENVFNDEMKKLFTPKK